MTGKDFLSSLPLLSEFDIMTDPSLWGNFAFWLSNRKCLLVSSHALIIILDPDTFIDGLENLDIRTQPDLIGKLPEWINLPADGHCVKLSSGLFLKGQLIKP